MKLKMMFVFTLISFANPMLAMADQLTNYAKGDTKVGCNLWRDKMLAQSDAEHGKDARSNEVRLPGAGTYKSAQAK